ncbi:MAG: hypothetical protein KC656_26870, partial [Myxococcales bacterium]|nr:hypothetical protein [Myxococcales bacterium]
AAWTWWMAVLMVALARRARAAKEQDDFARAMALGVLTGLAAWHLSGLTEFNFGDSEVMLLLFLVTGLTLGMGPEIRRGARGPGPASGATVPPRPVP